MKTVLNTLGDAQDLTAEAAEAAFSALMGGELSPAVAGAFLMGLRAKGETAVEMAAAVRAALARAKLVEGIPFKRIDPVGTGGDNSSSFNCSTATALVLAGMGHKVVKHGNRAVSSTSGSADAVEELGLPMYSEPEDIIREVQERGFVFLFAPNFHPAFRHIMPVRKELGIRTLFNLLGPLLNPARPTHQLLGVARPEIMRTMAEVLLEGGIERAAVVHGAGGFDELTPFGTNQVVWVADGSVMSTELDPAELGFESCAPDDVAVHSREEAMDTLREVLSGKGPKAMREMLALNVAVSLHLLEDGMSMSECVERARGAVSQGVAMKIVGQGELTMTLPRMLEAFIKAKQAEIDTLHALQAEGALPQPWHGVRLPFLQTLRDAAAADGIAVIAEYKRASPSQGVINDRLSPEDVALAYTEGGAAALSVLTEEEHFQGELGFLERMRPAGLPLLRKDFLLDPLQVTQTAATPASALLLIVRMLSPDELGEMLRLSHDAGLDAVVEAFDEQDVSIAQQAGARIIQINNRDLDTLAIELETSERLASMRQESEMWISASGMGSFGDLERMRKLGFEAALVGTSLMGAPDPGAALAAMRKGATT